MRKLFRFFLGLAASGALLFSAVYMAAYIRESSASSRLNESLAKEAVVVKESVGPSNNPEFTMKQELNGDPHPTETVPIEVDFDVLLKSNADVIGWIYCEDTPINYPVVQGKDNDYYLSRMIDGTRNSSGTLFADYRNAGDFSDGNTIVYGHNMKNKEMFGTLPNYKKQSYFDEHPVMWLLTPEENYKVELVAGYVTSSTSEIYSFGQTEADVVSQMEQAADQSTFLSGFQVSQGDRFVTLSTCSYEYDNARYVLIGRLKPLE